MKRKWKYVSKYKQEQTLELYTDIKTGGLLFSAAVLYIVILFLLLVFE